MDYVYSNQAAQASGKCDSVTNLGESGISDHIALRAVFKHRIPLDIEQKGEKKKPARKPKKSKQKSKNPKENNKTNEQKEEANKKTPETVCYFWNKGYCKQGDYCLNFHAKEECQEYLEIGRCGDPWCKHRHRSVCKYWSEGGCSRGEECSYLHATET